MSEGGVTHKELNEALGNQTARIIATVRRTEDNLKEDISDVKVDVNKDVEAVSDRVTYIERRGRNENILASILSSVLTFLGVVFYGRFTGG